ncbi:MAG: arginase family protein [Pseudomonadota bacterium]
MNVCLIYAYWPNRPFGMNWCDLPLALREAGLPEELHKAGHKVSEVTFFAEGDAGEELVEGIALARDIGRAINEAHASGDFPVVLVGSCALAALGVGASWFGGETTGVLWCDAHPDLNTPETSLSGLFEGMALSAACGHSWQALAREGAGATPFSLSRVALFGARDIDDAEQSVIEAEQIPLVQSPPEAAARFEGCAHRYVHLDMDVHNPEEVVASGFEISGGPGVDDVVAMITGLGPLTVMSVSGLDASAVEGDVAVKTAIAHVAAVVAAQASMPAATGESLV